MKAKLEAVAQEPDSQAAEKRGQFLLQLPLE